MSALATTLLKLVAAIAPLLVLGWCWRIFPRRPLVFLALLPTAITLILVGWEEAIWLVVGIDLVCAALVGSGAGGC